MKELRRGKGVQGIHSIVRGVNRGRGRKRDGLGSEWIDIAFFNQFNGSFSSISGNTSILLLERQVFFLPLLIILFYFHPLFLTLYFLLSLFLFMFSSLSISISY